MDPEEALKGIIVSRVYNSDHQVLVVDKAWDVCESEGVKLIALDSLTSHFRAEYLGRETLSYRQQRLNAHLHKLTKIAETLNLAVVVTNQMIANPDVFFANPDKPAGGHVVAHSCTYRILIRKGKGGARIARMFDAPHLPKGETSFSVTEGGIEDLPQEK